jgi:hypothetical protein
MKNQTDGYFLEKRNGMIQAKGKETGTKLRLRKIRSIKKERPNICRCALLFEQILASGQRLIFSWSVEFITLYLILSLRDLWFVQPQPQRRSMM